MSSSEPEPPENVRIVVAAGRPPIPVECVYVKLDSDGCHHHWDAVLPAVYVPDIADGCHILIDKLPAHTSVGLRIEWGDWTTALAAGEKSVNYND